MTMPMDAAGGNVVCEQAEWDAIEAARPGLKLLFMEPKDSRRPTGCEAASPSAQTICCSVSPISLPVAAAAPNTPAVPVMCQPTS